MGKKGKKDAKKGARKQQAEAPAESKKDQRQRRRELKKERARAKHSKAEYAEFNRQLRDHNFAIRDVRGDGNCLFRAVCDQIEGSERDHWDLRQRTLDFMEEHRDGFEPFVENDESFDDYVRRLRREGVWGGHLELQAMSLLLGRNIIVHQLGQPSWELRNHGPDAPAIMLSYHEQQHYASVRHISEVVSRGVGASVANAGSAAAQPAASDPVEITDKQLAHIQQNTGCFDTELIRRLWTTYAAEAAGRDPTDAVIHAVLTSAWSAEDSLPPDAGPTASVPAPSTAASSAATAPEAEAATPAAATASTSAAAAATPSTAAAKSTSKGGGSGGKFGRKSGDNEPRRNDPCPCGSGLRYRKCCHKTKVAAAQGRANPQRDEARKERLANSSDAGGAAVDDRAVAADIEAARDGMQSLLI